MFYPWCFFFLFLFATLSQRSLDRSPWNFATWSESCCRWRPITTSGFVRHLENVQITLFIFLHSRLTIFQRWNSRNITSMNLYCCFTGVHCWIVGKPVYSWTLDADRPRKTGSRYNDTLIGIRKPKGSVTMLRKLTVLIHCLVGDFRLKLHWGGGKNTPPLPGQGLKRHEWLLMVLPWQSYETWPAIWHHTVTCYPTQLNAPRPTRARRRVLDLRTPYPGRMESWVDLGYPAMERPGIKLSVFRSQVRRPIHYTTEPCTTDVCTSLPTFERFPPILCFLHIFIHLLSYILLLLNAINMMAG